jgi:predicted peptidase
VDKVFQDGDGEHHYVVYVPSDYTPDRKWPIVLFLHGSGARGTDNRKQINEGLGPAIREDPSRCPAIVVFPQAESLSVIPINAWFPTSPDGQRALIFLDRAEKEYSTDPDRVYLTGLSMGGIGSWAQALNDPDRWAAVVPICGGGNQHDVEKIAHLPIWVFHGTLDTTIPVSFSRTMIKSLKKAGGSPRYTEYPTVGHNSWSRAYREPELWPWLFSQSRGVGASTSSK